MVKYRVTINRDLCIDCGIATGHCPTHAKELSRLLKKDQESQSMGVFLKPLYDHVKQLVDACPTKALIIEKIEE